MSNIWFTSDSHFSHKSILAFEDRPYGTVDEMNEDMIDAWNKTVNKDDVVYHLGDFVFGGITRWMDIVPRLNGKINLIQGNHDYSKVVKKMLEQGYLNEWHPVGTKLKCEGFSMWLSHYPMEIGLRPRKFSVHGHIHSSPSTWDNQLNVGVDSELLSYKPFGELLHIDELVQIMQDRTPSIIEKFEESRR